VATAAPSSWSYREPDLWPSIAKASALLLSLEARGGVHEHLAPIADDEPPPLLESPGLQRQLPRPAPPTPPHRGLWLHW
jgi:hypothetical protein